MRPVLAMLGRRCGGSGSPAASIHRVLHPAAPRTTPLPSLRPASTMTPPPPQSFRPSAARSHGSYQRFSTGCRMPADKAENWWQRCMYRIKNADIEQQSKFCFWYSMVVIGSSTCYMVKKRKDIRLI